MNDALARRTTGFLGWNDEFYGSGVDCTIRNMSPIGAMLDVTSPVGIPHEITLNIINSHERQIAVSSGARKSGLVWSSPN